MDKKFVEEFAKAAVSYGKAVYQHQELLELVKRQKSTLATLQRWEKKPETRKVSAHALEVLRQEILTYQQRIWSDTRDSKLVGSGVARLKHALETKTRQLVAAK